MSFLAFFFSRGWGGPPWGLGSPQACQEHPGWSYLSADTTNLEICPAVSSVIPELSILAIHKYYIKDNLEQYWYLSWKRVSISDVQNTNLSRLQMAKTKLISPMVDGLCHFHRETVSPEIKAIWRCLESTKIYPQNIFHHVQSQN